MFKKYFLQISLLVTAIPVFASQSVQSGSAAPSGTTPSDDVTTMTNFQTERAEMMQDPATIPEKKPKILDELEKRKTDIPFARRITVATAVQKQEKARIRARNFMKRERENFRNESSNEVKNSSK